VDDAVRQHVVADFTERALAADQLGAAGRLERVRARRRLRARQQQQQRNAEETAHHSPLSRASLTAVFDSRHRHRHFASSSSGRPHQLTCIKASTPSLGIDTPWASERWVYWSINRSGAFFIFHPST